MELVRDLAYTRRLLARSRGFAIATLMTIALGVGGTAAVFSVVYGVLLRPLDPRLHGLFEVSRQRHGSVSRV